MKMLKGRAFVLAALAVAATFALAACSSQPAASTSSAAGSATTASASSSSTASATGDATSSATSASSASSSSASQSASAVSAAAGVTGASLGAVANTLAQDEEALVSTYADKFQQVEYADAETGLSVTYNLFLPEGYDASKSYPMVVFIGDSTCAGTDATRSLTQGRGALVWATDEWQAVNPTIVCVPTYPETILDDHNGYTTTEYVELTKRLIDAVAGQYAVDSSRIYGTGQSMGCMTTLILDSEYPDLYAACMFVDGQWDISTLAGLKDRTFVYFAAEDDTNAFNGMNEVMDMFSSSSVPFSYVQWDGTWSPDELSAAAEELFAAGAKANFISWKTGTVDASTANMGGMSGGGSGGRMGGGPGGSASASASASSASASADGSNNAAPSSSDQTSGSANGESASQSSGGGSAMGSVGYHMASFDYAYNCVAVMEWLFQQSR